MKNRICGLSLTLLILFISSSVFAVAPGFYLGFMTGPATNDASKNVQAQVMGSHATTLVNSRSNQWGSRIFMGYKFGQYAGVEGGLDYFSSIRFNTKGVKTCNDPVARVRAFDLVLKGEFPIYGFSPYVKAGVAIIYLTTSGSLNPDFTRSCGKSQHVNRFRPTYSLGASYDLTQSWVTDVSWNRISVGNVVQNVNYYAVGIAYHFVDRYCGQFLCDD